MTASIGGPGSPPGAGASAETPAAGTVPGSDRVLARLMTLHPKLIDLTLDRVYRLLRAVGNPHMRLPPVVHVAGTNGKGSVIACLRAMLQAAGRPVHVYTSPHLVRFHERIRLGTPDGGRLIAEPALLALLEDCEAANGGAPITYFEITTVAALLAFARAPADALLLEVGLGGRLDATNVVDRPALCVITPVSPDHQQFLGDTVAAIAGEKAGILKPGVPAVVGRQEPEAAAVIRDRAAALDVPLLLHGRDWAATPTAGGLRIEDRDGSEDLPPPALPGAHQRDNAALAAVAARQLQRTVAPGLDAAARCRGVATARWPGRLQRLAAGSLPALLPAGWELWLDGGHNRAAGQALADQAAHWSDRPLYLVAGMLTTKDTAGFFDPLLPWATGFHTVAIPGETNSRTADAAAAIARERGAAACPADSVPAALRAVAAQADPGAGPGRVLICGSLYLAGRVLALNSDDRPVDP